MKGKDQYLGLYFAIFTKRYYGVLSKKLEKIAAERYFLLILIIHESETNCTQQYLADRLQVDKVAMVKILDYLVKKGYVERERSKKDRRETHVCLTAKAKRDMKEIYSAIDKTNKQAMAGLTAKQQSQFFDYMHVIYENLMHAHSRKMTLELK